VADRLPTARLPPCIPHTNRLRMVMPAPIFLTWIYDRYARRLPSCAMRTSLLTIASKRRGKRNKKVAIKPLLPGLTVLHLGISSPTHHSPSWL
jgi:hypothetical protein